MITAMKYINKIQIGLAAVALTVFLSCSKEGEYTLENTPPLDFRSYYNGLTVTFANATEGATDISWNFGDGSADVTGDSVVHVYAETGNYVITMHGTYQGTDYIFHTILRVDKPSVIDLTDDSFDDWNNVNYPDFQLDGQDNVLGGKVDYDANSIYFFVEYLTGGAEELAGLDAAVMDLYVDNDNSLTTGFSGSIGADLLFEGNIPSEWLDYYYFTGADQSDWGGWVYFNMDNAIQLGHTETEGDTIRMEFAISREAFKIDKDACAFRMDIVDSDWSSIGSLAKDNDTRIVILMNKQ
jgi:PKD domain